MCEIFNFDGLVQRIGLWTGSQLKHRIQSDVKCKVPLKRSLDLFSIKCMLAGMAHQFFLCSWAGTQALEHFVLAHWRLILRNLAQIVWQCTLNTPRLPSRLKWKNLMEQFPFARLEHVSFSYNRLEDEVCSSVVRLLLGHCCESLWGSMVQIGTVVRWCWRLMGFQMCFRRMNAKRQTACHEFREPVQCQVAEYFHPISSQNNYAQQHFPTQHDCFFEACHEH